MHFGTLYYSLCTSSNIDTSYTPANKDAITTDYVVDSKEGLYTRRWVPNCYPYTRLFEQ